MEKKGGEEERCDEGQIDEKNGGYDQKRRMSRNVRMHTEMRREHKQGGKQREYGSECIRMRTKDDEMGEQVVCFN